MYWLFTTSRKEEYVDRAMHPFALERILKCSGPWVHTMDVKGDKVKGVERNGDAKNTRPYPFIPIL